MSSQDLPKVFGHRGACGYCVENTISSFNKAVEQGADGLETDVYVTTDGIPFLFHDSTLKLEGVPKPVKAGSLAYKDLEKVILPHNEKVPTLQEFCDRFEKTKTKSGQPLLFSFDVHNYNATVKLVQMVRKYNLDTQTYLTCNWIGFFNVARKISKDLHIIASNSISRVTPFVATKGWSHYRRFSVEGFNIRARKFDQKYFNFLKQGQYSYFIWDLHSEESLRKYLPFKPTAIYSNYPDLAVKIRNELFH